jgi:hypothetical protein
MHYKQCIYQLRLHRVYIPLVLCIRMTVTNISLIGCTPWDKPINRLIEEEVKGNPAVLFPETSHCFRLPEIPQVITDVQERRNYIATHYWQYCSFEDTAFVCSDTLEQIFADFIGVLTYTDNKTAVRAIGNLLVASENDSVARYRFRNLSELYLDDPNSPMCNETYYIRVLEQVINSQYLSMGEKLRYQDRLKQMKKNRPGMAATNFTYTQVDGKVATLYEVKAKYTLLFFYDPNCEACKAMKQIIQEYVCLRELQHQNSLCILAIYPGEQVDEWIRGLAGMPRQWLIGYDADQQIHGKQLYSLRALPCLYFLDSKKQVLLKDVTLNNISRFLQSKEWNK